MGQPARPDGSSTPFRNSFNLIFRVYVPTHVQSCMQAACGATLPTPRTSRGRTPCACPAAPASGCRPTTGKPAFALFAIAPQDSRSEIYLHIFMTLRVRSDPPGALHYVQHAVLDLSRTNKMYQPIEFGRVFAARTVHIAARMCCFQSFRCSADKLRSCHWCLCAGSVVLEAVGRAQELDPRQLAGQVAKSVTGNSCRHINSSGSVAIAAAAAAVVAPMTAPVGPACRPTGANAAA